MKLKTLTKQITTLARTAVMATTMLLSPANVSAASKKAQKKANKAYAQAIKKNKVAKFTSYSLIEVTGGGTKELITRNSSPSAKGKARNLNFYAYSKGKVKKIWSTSDQAITYNKKQKTLVSLQSFGINEDKSAYSVYDIYKYNGKKIVKKGTYTFVRNTHFEDSHGNRPTYAEMESEDYNERVHVVVDKETYTKKETGKTETITKKRYNVATKGTVGVWAYNTATKSELIKKLNK